MKCMFRALIHSEALSTLVMCFICSFVPRWFNGRTKVLKNKASEFSSPVAFAFIFPPSSRFLPTVFCLLESERDLMAHCGADDYFPFLVPLCLHRCHQSLHQSLPEPVFILLPWFICLNHAEGHRASRDGQRLHSYRRARKTSALPPPSCLLLARYQTSQEVSSCWLKGLTVFLSSVEQKQQSSLQFEFQSISNVVLSFNFWRGSSTTDEVQQRGATHKHFQAF